MGGKESDTANEWHVLLGDKRLGPYAFEWLVEAARIKLLRETDLVGCPGQTTWILARSVPGLKFSASTDERASEIVVVSSEIVVVSASHHASRGGRSIWLATIAVTLGVLVMSAEVSTTILRTMTGYAMDAFDSIKSDPAKRLDRTLNSIPAYAILKRIDQPAHDRIVRELSGQYADGATEDQVLSGARNVLFKTLQPYFMRASDAAVLENIDIVISYMDGLRDTDAESCVSLVDEPKGAKLAANLRKQFPVVFERELALHAEILSSVGPNSPNAAITQQQAGPYLVKVFNTIGSRPGMKLGLLARDKLARSEYQDYCQVTLALFREIRQLPRHEAVQVLRYLYSLGSQ